MSNKASITISVEEVENGIVVTELAVSVAGKKLNYMEPPRYVFTDLQAAQAQVEKLIEEAFASGN